MLKCLLLYLLFVMESHFFLADVAILMVSRLLIGPFMMEKSRFRFAFRPISRCD